MAFENVRCIFDTFFEEMASEQCNSSICDLLVRVHFAEVPRAKLWSLSPNVNFIRGSVLSDHCFLGCHCP